MYPSAPIRLIQPKIDPWTKQMRTRPYGEFDIQTLGIDRIEDQCVKNAPAVRLPEGIEPGTILDLYVGHNGQVLVSVSDISKPSLLDILRVVVTEELSVQVWSE